MTKSQYAYTPPRTPAEQVAAARTRERAADAERLRQHILKMASLPVGAAIPSDITTEVSVLMERLGLDSQGLTNSISAVRKAAHFDQKAEEAQLLCDKHRDVKQIEAERDALYQQIDDLEEKLAPVIERLDDELVRQGQERSALTNARTQAAAARAEFEAALAHRPGVRPASPDIYVERL